MHSVITAVFTRMCPCNLFTIREAVPFIKEINLHVVFFFWLNYTHYSEERATLTIADWLISLFCICLCSFQHSAIDNILHGTVTEITAKEVDQWKYRDNSELIPWHQQGTPVKAEFAPRNSAWSFLGDGIILPAGIKGRHHAHGNISITS